MSSLSPGGSVCRIASRSDPGDLVSALAEATDLSVRAVGPTGADALEPLVLVTRDGRTACFTACDLARVESIAAQLDDGLPTGAADAVVSHEDDLGRLPTPDLAPLDVGRRSVLARCGWARPTEPEEYRSTGGFSSVGAGEGEVLSAAASVQGRGWGDGAADEPVAATWESVADASETPAVVVNAHGSPGDRLVLESAPFLALEGALAAARLVAADRVVVYLSAADELARARVGAAVEALPGDVVPAGVDVSVATGPDEHRAAEPTMALEAIEGSDRLEARLRPPGPAAAGLFGRPTLVHTPRTFAQVLRALEGAEPTRVVTVRGEATATIELAEGAPLSAARQAASVDGQFKAACVGGTFGGLTPDLDVAVTPEALAGAGLGTEGVVELFGEDDCLLAHVGETVRYGKAENCGRCVPCREGSKQLTTMLREPYDGHVPADGLTELLRVIDRSSICGFGRDMTRPVATALEHFEDELRAHAEGRCPAGACGMEVAA